MDRLGYERVDSEFAAVTAQLAAAASACAADHPVPTCPEWTMRDLVSHVGTGHRWAAEIIDRRLQTLLPQTAVAAPEEPEWWPVWLAEGADLLRTAVREGGPDQPVWTWQADRSAGFWLRRMLHDELVHRFDAELAQGPAGEVAPDLAVDGVTDQLDCIARLSLPDVRARGGGFGQLVGEGQTLLFEATDPELEVREWLVERGAEGVTWRHASAPADVTVRAPARELLLVINRRLEPAEAGAEVGGDRGVLAHWLEHTRF